MGSSNEEVRLKTVWTTSDGTDHASFELATAHAKFLKLAERMDRELYLRDSKEVLAWLVNNKEEVLSLLESKA